MSTEAERLLEQARQLIDQATRLTEQDQGKRELAEKLGGEDSWSTGDVIVWERRIRGQAFTYAALRHGGRSWAITGRGDQIRCTWDGLLSQLTLPGVQAIRFMTEFQEVTP